MFLIKKIRPLINLTIKRKSNISAISWHSLDEEETKKKFEKYGGKYNVALILGVGKSRETMKALQDLLMCCGAPLAWEIIDENLEHEHEFDNMILAIKRNGLAIKGSLDPETDVSEIIMPTMSKNINLRRVLDLHALITECKSFKGLHKIMRLHKEIDIVLVRQNTEGDHLLLEHSPEPSIVEHLKVTTLNNSERVAEIAFRYAVEKKRKKVQCIHRRDVMPLSEGVFIQGFLMAAERHKEVTHEILDLGTAVRNFMRDPKALDVVVTNSLDGAKLNSVLNGILGSPSLVASSSIGNDAAVFEPSSKLSARWENPTPYFLSAAMLLEHLDLTMYADAIRAALEEVFYDQILPMDLGGKADMFTFTTAVIKKLQPKVPYVLCSYNHPKPIPCKHPPIKPFVPQKT